MGKKVTFDEFIKDINKENFGMTIDAPFLLEITNLSSDKEHGNE